MIKMREAQNDHDRALAAAEYIIRVGSEIASSAPIANDQDLQLLTMAARRQGDDFRLLERIIARVDSGDVQEALYELVTKLMLGAFVIGSASCLSPEAARWREQIKAYTMRQKRAEKNAPANEALEQQIKSSKAFQMGASAEAVLAELKTGALPGSEASLSTVKRRLALIKAA